MLFSIVMVVFNAGIKVEKTLDSVFAQTEEDYEIVVKDGGSTDDTLKYIPMKQCVKVCSKPDKGIYDAMNQAVDICNGDYIIFMNAGDLFYDKDVLANVKKKISEVNSEKIVYYGDYVSSDTLKIQTSPLSDFALFRKPICHQTIFYSRALFSMYGKYNLEYKICADHELTMRLRKEKVGFVHIPICIANYEGNGVSESEKGYQKAQIEKKSIDKKYLGKASYIKCQFLYKLTFPTIRRWMLAGQTPVWIKRVYYSVKNQLEKEKE